MCVCVCVYVHMVWSECVRQNMLLRSQGYLQGQLEPSGLLAAVLLSGQQPKGVLSQDERSSGGGMVVTAAVGSDRGRGGRERDLHQVPHTTTSLTGARGQCPCTSFLFT